MKIVVLDDALDVANKAASYIAQTLEANPRAHIGLATGATQNGVYRDLIERHRRGEISFGQASFFMLDEYVGVPVSSPTSFQQVLHSELLGQIDADDSALTALDGNAQNLEQESARFEKALKDSGGIDMQLLGIGTNGHIGFNEPGSPLDSRTREVVLEQATRANNAPYFASIEDVPRTAITQGLGTIMEAQSILLVALGSAKSEAVKAMVRGPISEDCPASILQLHPSVTVILDRAAAALIGRERDATTLEMIDGNASAEEPAVAS